MTKGDRGNTDLLPLQESKDPEHPDLIEHVDLDCDGEAGEGSNGSGMGVRGLTKKWGMKKENPPPSAQNRGTIRQNLFSDVKWTGERRRDKRTVSLPPHVEPFLREVIDAKQFLRKLWCKACGGVGSDANRKRFVQMHTECNKLPLRTSDSSVMSGIEKRAISEVEGADWSTFGQRKRRQLWAIHTT